MLIIVPTISIPQSCQWLGKSIVQSTSKRNWKAWIGAMQCCNITEIICTVYKQLPTRKQAFIFIKWHKGIQQLSAQLLVMTNLNCKIILQVLYFPKWQILDSSKLREIADDNFNFNLLVNGRMFSKWVENTVGKRELLIMSNFSFSHSAFQRHVLQTHKNQSSLWKINPSFFTKIQFQKEHCMTVPMFSCECLIFSEKYRVKQGA